MKPFTGASGAHSPPPRQNHLGAGLKLLLPGEPRIVRALVLPHNAIFTLQCSALSSQGITVRGSCGLAAEKQSIMCGGPSLTRRTEAEGAMPRSPIPPAEHRCSTLERNTHVLAGAPLHFALTQALAPTPSSLRQQEHIVCRQISCASLAHLPKPPQRAQEPTSFNCSGGHFGHRESPPAPGKRCRTLASSQLVKH